MPHPLHPAHVALAVLAGLVFIFGGFAIVLQRERLHQLYTRHLGETVRERLFIASLGFYMAFAAVRILTHAIHAGRGPFHNLEMGGRHIHHMVWGVLLLLLAGYGWLAEVGTGTERSSRWAGRILSLFYGIGAALTLDEFALWLNLRDVYWEREGRASIDAIVLFGALLNIGLLGGPFLRALAREVWRRPRPPE